ncbi:hypothetical protein IFM89_017357 [Coptis chinensis]|uniref:Carboxypeptidase n=1 Tax=Coptis chinensis TaxID=261450 RepID=A0A835H6S5_9MAGN|nr:hypothetical protein IFM89_017357 [Coptis chinensis]
MRAKFLISFLLLSLFVTQTIHARQGVALTRLYKMKRERKIDTNFYDELQVVDETRVLSQEGLKENDRIEKLPGQPHNVDFAQYGGYVTVDEKAGRAFYYYFTEAEHSKESKPLLLWLNGGPGCSSLAYGAMQELGPFRVASDGKTLQQNPYAWNKVANVLFLESPAGVGFSYTNTTSDLKNSGDKMTADDNYVFLLNWLKRFPEYKDRDFYISGESYAGHYVPQLAHNIVRHNKLENKTTINLKGVIIGNAVINDNTDEKGMYEYLWTHALLSDETNQAVQKYCDFSDFSPYAPKADEPKQCTDAITEANNNINLIDIYNIYAPTCHLKNLTDKPKKASGTIDPCSDNYVSAYLNTPEVQTALHANVTKLNYDWESCSGDIDGIVPVTSTSYMVLLFRAISWADLPHFFSEATMRAKFLISFLLLSLFVTQKIHARQGDALTRLYKMKRERKIDTNFYDELRVVDETRVLSQEGLKENDRIEKLPGQPHNVDFAQYGGYVTVDEKAGRAFYYYFTEAEHSKESKPLLLWLNGGPGCSSLGFGAMQELGPFRVASDGKTLHQNPYAWNKVANVLFLESPAGVGFSYTNTTSDLKNSGDKMTADDNYVFLLNWLKRFPEYKDRDFYISGESYAGHYVPQLAHNIVRHNKLENKTTINLKGIIIGNALINDNTDEKGMYEYLWTHALSSDETNHAVQKYCDFSEFPRYATKADEPKQCTDAIIEANNNINLIDIYNIYAPTCHLKNLTDKPKKASGTIDPCSDNYVSAYLNTPEVGGYTIVYKGDLTFATVRGAGHQVPSYQPTRALTLIKYFLDGKPLPRQ